MTALFENAENILNVKFVRQTSSGVVLAAETPHDQPFWLEISFVSKDVIRFHMFQGKNQPVYPLVHLPHEPVKVRFQEEPGKLFLKSESLSCNIELLPFFWNVCDAAGNVIWSQQRDDSNVRGSSNVPSLCFTSKSGEITSITDSFVLEPDDRVYGFGEKFFAHDKRGHTIVTWNLDAYGVETERAYKNIPFFLCSKGYGFFVNSTARITHAAGDPTLSRASYVLKVEDQQLDCFVIVNSSYKQILQRYSELTGKSPVPPQWAFGLWMSRCYFHNRQVAEEVANRLREIDIPCDVLVFDGYWVRDGHQCDFIWDEERFPDTRGMLAGLKSLGFKSCVWEGPFVPSGTEMFSEGERGNFLLMTPDHHTYLIHTGLVMASHKLPGFSGQETAGSFDGLPAAPPAALVDFTNPQAVKWYQEKHTALLEQGVDVFKTDFGEQVPEDAVSPYSGLTGKELHNLYTVLYNQAVFEATLNYKGRGLVWARSAGIGSQQYPVHWGGDPQTSFSSLAGSLRGGLSLGLSGVPFWGSDIGGFFGKKPSVRLYTRWAQFGLLSGLARCHGTTPREPWAYGSETVAIFRKYAKLRYRLIPYLYSCAHASSQTGLPLMRPLLLEFQSDPAAQAVDSQYLLGEWLMIAPMLSEKDYRTIYLPAGRWLDYWTGTIYEGPVYLDYSAPLDTLPIFLRSGAIVPLGPDIHFVGEKPLDPITLLIFPGEQSTQDLWDDDEKVVITCRMTADRLSLEIGSSSKNYFIHMPAIPHPIQIEDQQGEIPLLDKLDDSSRGWIWTAGSGLWIKCSPTPTKIVILF
jgi:alpha-D-xyloside xylohydrolase